ncbi:MAG: CHAP domain-containing protein [Acidimicrobiales bacterium]
MRDGHRGGHGRVSTVRTVLTALATTVLLMTGSLAGATALGAAGGRAGAATIGGAETPNVYNSGGIVDFGDAQNLDTIGNVTFNSLAVAMATDPASTAANQGYWVAFADGGVAAEGDAGFYGSLGSLHLQGPIVAMAATPDGKGYWLAAMDGGVFALGDAGFYGSMGGTHLNQPIVGMAATPDGGGYWLVAADGGIFSFGDASFYGSMGGTPLNAPVTGMAASANGHGYWLVAADGGIFAFGNAPFLGSQGGKPLDNPVIDMVAFPHNAGYLLVSTDGGIFGFGKFNYYGSIGGGYGGNPADVPPIAGIALTPDQDGYWLLEPDGWNYNFSNPPPPPGPAGAIISVADSQVRSDPDPGSFCNPYGPCEEWCALFATWVWEQAGIPIPSFPFTGSIYDWAASDTAVLPPSAPPQAGDDVLYGTGPGSTATSVHVGVVVQVWPDGAVVTIEGDAGPAPDGSLAVVINGPYLPIDSANYNGFPIYAFAVP